MQIGIPHAGGQILPPPISQLGQPPISLAGALPLLGQALPGVLSALGVQQAVQPGLLGQQLPLAQAAYLPQLSVAGALAAKAAQVSAVKTWHYAHFATVADAVGYANIPPQQLAGEFGVTNITAGGYDGYYFF